MAVKHTNNVNCGDCLYFPLREALQAGGHGYCRRMEKARNYAWRATVLFKPATDPTSRAEQIYQFEVQQRKESDAKR